MKHDYERAAAEVSVNATAPVGAPLMLKAILLPATAQATSDSSKRQPQ